MQPPWLPVHGHEPGGELADAVAQGVALVVMRNGRITGYATQIAFFGHAVAETNDDLQSLIGAAFPEAESQERQILTVNDRFFSSTIGLVGHGLLVGWKPGADCNRPMFRADEAHEYARAEYSPQ